MTRTRLRKLLFPLLLLAPAAGALFVWLSPLAFVPVPWPDDSAFYFVAKELFQWPPRWVMLPQAPFEPTYRIFNFNTMPLYPVLIGLGRLIGIDGSFALKFWPLAAWALSGCLTVLVLLHRKLSPWLAGLIALLFALDPALRWASVLIRPESLIGLCGTALILGLTFGFPKRIEAHGRLWDPVAALLALAAYAHFNAIHLVFPVILVFARQPRRLLAIGAKTVLYLSPWLLAVLWHFKLFVHQMTTQWKRLAVPNAWLDSVSTAVKGLFQEMGSPVPFSPLIGLAGIVLWLLILVAAFAVVYEFVILLQHALGQKRKSSSTAAVLLPSAAWVLSSVWLWHTKPEVWFTYYIHVAALTFAGVLSVVMTQDAPNRGIRFRRNAGIGAFVLLAPVVGVFAYTDIDQTVRLSASRSWRWITYHDFVECVDQRLSAYEAALASRAPGESAPFKVWCPTFPDITIELSRRHPDWELTRTNDFHERAALALQHGHDVHAVVVTETLGSSEETVTGPWTARPDIRSLWLDWKPYWLNTLYTTPGWKPNRYLCQRGRWQAFIFEK